MSSSIELRVPFLDTEVFASAHDVNASRRGGPPKLALVQALGDPDLARISKRRKRGFALPMDQWLSHGPLRELAEQWSLAALNAWLESLERNTPGVDAMPSTA